MACWARRRVAAWLERGASDVEREFRHGPYASDTYPAACLRFAALLRELAAEVRGGAR